MLNPILTQYHLSHRFFDLLNGCSKLEEKRAQVENVLFFANAIVSATPPCILLDKELVLFCAEHYYDGYAEFYANSDMYSNLPYMHAYLGLARFDQWLISNCIVAPINQDIQTFRDVLLYHDHPQLCSSIISANYIELIHGIMLFEEVTSKFMAIPNIVASDSLGLVKSNPKAMQSYTSTYVYDHYQNGKPLPEDYHCKTYGEYTLSIAALLINCLIRYPYMKQLLLVIMPSGKSIIAMYSNIMRENLNPRMFRTAYSIIKRYVN